ncbi:MAG TPA: lamin tail domain-containing protein, partial [Candidatus Sulfotelmatobacter sp.]|nr:lamin tail domain-containing protein [Candidatus Sulfotelmatobacter sp.]
ASDPDGVAALTLHYAVNGGSWQTVAMGLGSDGSATYTGSIPAQTSGAVIQFYVEGRDGLGVSATYPPGGTNSRALIQVDATRLVAGKQTVRTIMTPADAALLHSFVNLMSDDLLRCTVVHNEQEVFYDARIRLHGSMFSRTDPANTGFTVKFPQDQLFRGSRGSIVVRRGNLVETMDKHILNQVGGLPANYNDVVYLVSHRADNIGTATLNLANYDDTYVDSQFEHNNDGTIFKLEGIRVYQATDDGTPEGYKLPQPVDFVWDYDITNLGDDPEQYRWSFLIQSQRARDDYSPIVAMGKAFGLSGAARQQAVAAAIDVDEWARYFALQTLVGVGDIYGVDNPHNIAFYARPDDGRVVVLQNDWGFAFGLYTGASIYGKNKVYEILSLPVYRRLYQGHLLDLMNSVYNSAYLSRWAQHFTKVTGADFSGVPGYAEARNAAVRAQLAAQIPFAITSNGGNDFTVNTPVVTLEGRGWINVHGIGLAGQTNLLGVTWLDDQRWQVQVPLAQGTNLIQLVAYDYRGAVVGQDSITVTTSLSGFSQRDYLRITEVMYHPSAPSASELAAGFTDREDFEFIELLNTGPTDVPLAGVRFTLGVTFDFTGSAVTTLAPAQRVVVVARRPAFACRYGTNCLVAGAFTGHLDNGGEMVRLVDSYGNIIQEFSYDDSGSWPSAADGEGSSLEVLNAN